MCLRVWPGVRMGVAWCDMVRGSETGARTVPAWCAGVGLLRARCLLGVRTVPAWCAHGACLVHAQCLSGASLVRMWLAPGARMAYA